MANQPDEQAVSDWCPDPGEPAADQDRKQLAMHTIQDSICQLGMRPLILTGALRHLLIQLFSDPDQIEEPDLRASIWQPGTATDILIETVTKWTGNLVEVRPALLIKRNAYRNLRLGINDHVGLTPETFDAYNTAWVGSHTIFCINGSGATTELLATEVQRALTQFGPAIAPALQLMRFQVTEVGEISEVEESKKNFGCPINIGWAYQEGWELSRESLKLMDVTMEFDPVRLGC